MNVFNTLIYFCGLIQRSCKRLEYGLNHMVIIFSIGNINMQIHTGLVCKCTEKFFKKVRIHFRLV